MSHQQQQICQTDKTTVKFDAQNEPIHLERGYKQSQAFGKSMFLYLKSYLYMKPFLLPTRNILTICHVLRRLIATRKVPFGVLIRCSEFSVESNRMPLMAVTHAPAVHSSPNPNLNHNLKPIRRCFPKLFTIRT